MNDMLPLDNRAFRHEVNYYGLSAAMLGVGIVCIGGTGLGDTLLTSIECYFPLLNRWVEVANLPTPRRRFGGVVHMGKLYVIGGFTGSRQSNSVLCLDLSTKICSLCAPMSSIRTGCIAVVDDDLIYVIGGFYNRSAIHLVECFDPSKNEWRELPHLNIPRYKHFDM